MAISSLFVALFSLPASDLDGDTEDEADIASETLQIIDLFPTKTSSANVSNMLILDQT